MSPKITTSKLPNIFNELELDDYFTKFSNLVVSDEISENDDGSEWINFVFLTKPQRITQQNF